MENIHRSHPQNFDLTWLHHNTLTHSDSIHPDMYDGRTDWLHQNWLPSSDLNPTSVLYAPNTHHLYLWPENSPDTSCESQDYQSGYFQQMDLQTRTENLFACYRILRYMHLPTEGNALPVPLE